MKKYLAVPFILVIFVLVVSVIAADVTSLIKNLGDKDKDKAKEASDELAKIGKSVVPELIKAMEGKDQNRRRYAARAIREMGQDGEEAIPILSDLIKSNDSHTREYVVEALGNMTNQRDTVLPILKKAAKYDDEKDVREKAKKAIEKLSSTIVISQNSQIQQKEDKNAYLKEPNENLTRTSEKLAEAKNSSSAVNDSSPVGNAVKEQGSDKASKALEELTLIEKQQSDIAEEKAKQETEINRQKALRNQMFAEEKAKQEAQNKSEALHRQQLSEERERKDQFTMNCVIIALVAFIILGVIGIIMGFKGKVYVYNNVFDVVLSGIFVVLIAVTLGLYSNGDNDYKGILYFTIFVGLAVSFNSYKTNKSLLKQLVVIPAKMLAILILLLSALMTLAALSAASKARKKETDARELIQIGIKSAIDDVNNARNEKLMNLAIAGGAGAATAFSFGLIKKLIKSKQISKIKEQLYGVL